jgi:hypothetical protein
MNTTQNNAPPLPSTQLIRTSPLLCPREACAVGVLRDARPAVRRGHGAVLVEHDKHRDAGDAVLLRKLLSEKKNDENDDEEDDENDKTEATFPISSERKKK